MKFRVKYVKDIGFFAQVKNNWFSSWKKIGRHNVGFGLCKEDCIQNPYEHGTLAIDACVDYLKWETKSENIKYSDVTSVVKSLANEKKEGLFA